MEVKVQTTKKKGVYAYQFFVGNECIGKFPSLDHEMTQKELEYWKKTIYVVWKTRVKE